MSIRSTRTLMLALPVAGIVWLTLIGSLRPHLFPLPAVLNATAISEVGQNPAQPFPEYASMVEKYVKSLDDAKSSLRYKGVVSIAGSDHDVSTVEITAKEKGVSSPLSEETDTPEPPQNLTAEEKAEKVESYIQAILDPFDTSYERMQCLKSVGNRYESLRLVTNDNRVRYFIALDLFQVEALLPRLMGTVVETMKYLGPKICAVSVVEGRSTDLTYDILTALKAEVEGMGSHFYMSQSELNPLGEEVNRIEALASLRNLALTPLNDSQLFDENTAIIFSNDIASCPEDFLELLYQHNYQEATMTCAMDWINEGTTFYDVWVSRSMNGDLFFEVPQDSSWAFKDNLFWNHELSKKKFDALQPFQVYSCWGGMVTLDAKPFIDGRLAFRHSNPDECYMGEPMILAKDMWQLGQGRILTVPTVAVGYSNDEGGKTKLRRGYVHDHVDMMDNNTSQTEKIDWKGPPGMLKCAPEWHRQSWVDLV